MNIVFRADASLDIGTGHIVRCLTLAQRLREFGAKCTFVCREHRGNLIAMIRQRGFAALALPAAENNSSGGDEGGGHSAWLGASWQTDAQQCLAALDGMHADWLIVDHYALGADWQRCLRAACDRVMVIDDLADRAHDCDLLLDQNLGRQRGDYAGLVPDACRILVGPRHALLRAEFPTLREASLARRAQPQLRHLLVSMGGVDKDNVTGRVLEALQAAALPADLRITVVMGATAPWLAEVRERAAGMPRATAVRVDVTDMADLMADSDLAIGAAGTTAWERCCLGLPTLIVVLADNQRQGAAALQAAGAALIVNGGADLAEDLQSKFAMCTAPAVLGLMQAASSAITDGRGLSDLLAVLGDE